MIRTAITAAPRETMYLSHVVQSHFDSDNHDPCPLVSMEPRTPGFSGMSRCEIVRHDTTEGIVDHWLKVLRILFIKEENHWGVILQDDAHLCHDVYTWLGELIGRLEHPIGCISLFCSEYNKRKALRIVNGWIEEDFHLCSLCGAVGVCLPDYTARAILNNEDKFKEMMLGNGRGLDTCISKFCHGLKNYIAYPSLINHIGDVSTSKLVNAAKRKRTQTTSFIVNRMTAR